MKETCETVDFIQGNGLPCGEITKTDHHASTLVVRTRSTSASPFFSCLAQAEYVVGAHAIVAAKRPQMPDGHFVYAILVARIDLLRRAQHFRDGRLLQVSVFAQFAQDFPVLFQTITPKKV